MRFAADMKQLADDAMTDIANTYAAVLQQHAGWAAPKIVSSPSHEMAEHCTRLEMTQDLDAAPEMETDLER